jgi:succinate dehydrogenase / fumarate reductase flavoprotein subunit
LVNPANRRKLDIIVDGTGLSGASAASSLGEMGYNVKVFCYQDSPRRAHSVAAQGGINAAKNYKNDIDCVYSCLNMIRGAIFRPARQMYTWALKSAIRYIDPRTALEFLCRDYGGLIVNRSFGGVLVSRNILCKRPNGAKVLIGAYSAIFTTNQPGISFLVCPTGIA